MTRENVIWVFWELSVLFAYTYVEVVSPIIIASSRLACSNVVGNFY